MKRLNWRISLLLILGTLMVYSPFALAKDKIVLSLQQNPATEEGLEGACVALQLGTGLLLSGKAKVTVFATLDGIYIADLATYGYDPYEPGEPADDPPYCDTLSPQTGPGEASLEELLFGFLDAGGEILLCPLCNYVRQPYTSIAPGDDRIYSASPIPLLIEATKVIDY